jgi:hypothetical protein
MGKEAEERRKGRTWSGRGYNIARCQCLRDRITGKHRCSLSACHERGESGAWIRTIS